MMQSTLDNYTDEATEDTSRAREAADLFQAHRDELGFVNEAQCREKSLYTVRRDGGRLAGAALVNHCVQKPQTTLYDIAVREPYRRDGVATELLQQIAGDSPHEKVVAKCPESLPANRWYEATGWTLVDVEDGKNRRLNVWEGSINASQELPSEVVDSVREHIEYAPARMTVGDVLSEFPLLGEEHIPAIEAVIEEATAGDS